MFAAGAASALKAHGNFRQKCKINWQIYARKQNEIDMQLLPGNARGRGRGRVESAFHDDDNDG